MNLDLDALALSVDTTELTGKISLELADKDPRVQALVLADLVSIHLCGFPRSARKDMLGILVVMINDMVPINEARIYDGLGHPQDRN
jgi:hypothetical protein